MHIAVGVDVSKGKSTIAIVSTEGEVLHTPFDIEHTKQGIDSMLEKLKFYRKEDIKFLMEATGHYHIPLLNYLIELGYFASIVNPFIIKKYCDMDLRKVKTDKKDSLKLAQYASEQWFKLNKSKPNEETRAELQFLSRQYLSFMSNQKFIKVQLTNLTDKTFPGIKELVDADNRYLLFLSIYEKYPHPSFILELTQTRFVETIEKIAKKLGHRIGTKTGIKLYENASNIVPSCPMNNSIQLAITNCISLLKEVLKTIDTIITKMDELASTLPEFEIVSNLKGVGPRTRSRIIAEVGDINRFSNANKLIAFAGIDCPPYQSGQFIASNRKITKRGNKHLRKTGYEIMSNIVRSRPQSDNAVYEFIRKKEVEGKKRKTAKIAGLNKFLRIYYARVKELYND